MEPTSSNSSKSDNLLPLDSIDRGQVQKDIERLRNNRHLMLDVANRKRVLSCLISLLTKHQAEIIEAMVTDFKAYWESRAEMSTLLSEAVYTLEHVEEWASQSGTPPNTPFAFKFDAVGVRPEPLGTCLIVGTWNYPLVTSLQPLISALAAGNTAFVKFGEQAMRTTKLLVELFSSSKEASSTSSSGVSLSSAVKVAVMGAEDSQWLVKVQPTWDMVMFTGSQGVGAKVRESLPYTTRLVLELGGKCPAIIAPDADLRTALRRITWGKWYNAGQTCIAPDHVILIGHDPHVVAQLILDTLKEFYGPSPATSGSREHYARIVNRTHFERLRQLMKDTVHLTLGDSDIENRCLAPTIVLNPSFEHPMMTTEIFGPILPLISASFGNLQDAIKHVNSQPAPLAVYLFGGANTSKMLDNSHIRAGTVVLNDVMMQMLIPELPFGGIAESGQGVYHGHYGFKTFSHEQSRMWRTDRNEWLNERTRYPPMSETKFGWTERTVWYKPSKKHMSLC